MKTFLLLLSLFSSTAQARMGDGEIGPPPRPSFPPCDIGMVNACRADELGKRDADQAQAHALDADIQKAFNEMNEAARMKSLSEAQDAMVGKEDLVLGDEISFLNRGEPAPAKEIIPGFASLEDVFGLTPDEKSWHEAYPAQRAKLLNDRLAQLRSERSKNASNLQQNSSNFISLNGQYQSLKSRQDSLYSDAQVHETRSGSECQQRYCAGR